ncbi:MAG: aminotransferase class I/II-fold pyridoxal phosphate-dependent enzyme [Nanoarchaeota archaeon]
MEFCLEDFIRNMKMNKPDVVLLTTPNNPTGKPIADEQIKRILRELPSDCIILFDRSLVNTLPEISSKTLLHDYSDKKIVVLHSFSKSHSLSEERIGFLATNNSEIAIELYNKRDLPHNLHALKKCLSVIDNEKIVKTKKRIIRNCNLALKDYFKDKKDFIYYDSHSNFALIKLREGFKSTKLEEEMRKKGILIMAGHKIGLSEEFVRLHMTNVKGVKKFLEEFNKIILS